MTHKVYEVRLTPGKDNSHQADIQAVLDKIDAAGGEVVAAQNVGGRLFLVVKIP